MSPMVALVLRVAVTAGAGPLWAEVVAPADTPSSTTWGQYAGLMVLTASVATVVSGAVTAAGRTWLQPILDYRKDQTAARLRAMTAELDAFRSDTERVRADYSSRLVDLEGRLNAAAMAEKDLIRSLSEANRESARVSQYLLVKESTLASGEPLIPPISDRAPVLDGPSVLLIDDIEETRVPLSVLLHKNGFPVTAVATLAAGLEALSDRPDIVLLDLMLPDGDGIEVLRRVRAEKLTTRVIVITGRDEARLAPVRALEPEAILIKPIDPYLLLDTMRGKHPDVMEKRG
jgi:CheY-like chemotaxis protein